MSAETEDAVRCEPTDAELFGDDPPMLAGMGPSPEGGWEVTTTGAHEVVLAMSDSMAKMLDDANAENYIEIRVEPSGEIAGYLLTISRGRGKTPHALRKAAEKRITDALALTANFDPTSGSGRTRTFIADLRKILSSVRSAGLT